MTNENYQLAINNTPILFPIFRVKDITRELQMFNDEVGTEAPDMVVAPEDFIYYTQNNFQTVKGQGVYLPKSFFPPENVEFLGYIRECELHTCDARFGA